MPVLPAFFTSGDMPAELSVVITTFNSAPFIGSALSSLAALPASESPAAVTVVDNCSSDGTAEAAASFGGVRVIRNTANLGLARANNIGAEASPPGDVLFLNPDVEVLPGSVGALLELARERPEAGLVGPALLAPDGTPQNPARTFPTLADIAARRTPLGRLSFARRRIERHFSPSSASSPCRVDWIVGAAMLLTSRGRDRFGLMSERFFLYFEDVEWCWRAWREGMEVWYHPGARIIHVARRESSGRPGRAAWLHLTSMLRFYCMHPSALTGRRPAAR